MANTPLDGRMTSFSSVPSKLLGDELVWLVQPGNANAGILYSGTLTILAQFFSAYPSLNTELITAGATFASPYSIETTDTRILFNKTLVTPSFAVAPLASTMLYEQPVLLKDLKGNAGDGTNTITISFTGGELCDGQSTLVINSSYGWVTINPTPGGGSWYQS